VRAAYLVCYDISDDKRLRKVFNLMRGFGDHLQFSVLECQFTPLDLVRCRKSLRAVINMRTRFYL
jgi:CRISPR-associated protein Cas2